MNHDQLKQKHRELKQKLADLNELARLEKLGISPECQRLLEKERRKIKKLERKQIKSED